MSSVSVAANARSGTIRARMLIDGDWRETGQLTENKNPSDLADPLGDYCCASPQDVEEAMFAARRALPGWARSNPEHRASVLRNVARLIEARVDALAHLLSREEGKVLKDSRGEVMRAAQIFHYYSGESLRHPGATYASLRGFDARVDHEPVGVVALITAWNFPFAVAAWKIAPALAYGNTVVFKPSEVTPACGSALAEILLEAGVPVGVFNLVHGPGAQLGELLIRGTDAVSFTGSTATGRKVLECAARGMKKVQLELGGKNPLVVADDADVELAADVALDGAFLQTGQRCTASSRLIVTAGIHDAFVERLAAKLRAWHVGHALDPASDTGPVVTEAQLAKDVAYIAGAREAGAQLLCGGELLERETQGYYLAPALFIGSSNSMRVNREEVFGPVAAVIRAADLDEAIAIANDTEYALSSGICTRSIASAERFRRATRSGMVTVNASTSGAEFHLAFGGRAPSGYGPREQGTATAAFFTESKTTYVNHGVL
jgi:acyl-CoA reductase-like NAD-dependent aldehyde dehydrogenase